jgi:hypothetical protein
MNFITLYRPEVFQGSKNKTGYFEGWYFKHVSSGFDHVLSVIPGISLAGNPHSFIQVIDGITGETHYIDFTLDQFNASKKKMEIVIGSNRFTPEGISLAIHADGFELAGELVYQNRVAWPGSVLAPGIMGWYGFVPRMECYHGVVSMDHLINGRIVLQGKTMDFSGGRGYIEKDWGSSMPESWIWMHANTFPERGTSIMFSVAKIPWRGKYFIGFISFFLHKGNVYKFMTYNGSHIRQMNLVNQQFDIILTGRQGTLTISAHQKTAGKLKAPVHGLMERYIKESVDSIVKAELTDPSGQVIFAGEAPRAGLEIVGNTEELVDGIGR